MFKYVLCKILNITFRTISLTNTMKFSTNILLILESSKINKNETTIKDLILKINSWDIFIELAFAHGVFPLVYNTLKTYTQEIPAAIIIMMKQNYMNIVKENMLMSAELVRVMHLLETNNIKAISFKGPLLSQMAYDDITSRQYADLDILVDDKDLYKAANLLIANKYTNTSPISLLKNTTYLKVDNDFSFYTKNNIHIELHWKLFREKIGLHMNFDEYYNNKSIVSVNNNPINTLKLELLFVYLCLHGSKHAWERVEWINDIYMLTKNTKINWTETINIAKIMQCESSLYLGLNLVQKLYNKIPPKQLILEVNSTYINELTEEVFNFIEDNLVQKKEYAKIKSFQAKLLNTKVKKIKHFIFHYISITKNDYEAFPLPSYLRFLYYIIKPFRLIIKTIKK